MSDLVVFLSLIASLLTLCLVGLIVWRGRSTSLAVEDEKKPRIVSVARPVSSDTPFRKARPRRHRIQERAEAVRQENSDEDDHGNDDDRGSGNGDVDDEGDVVFPAAEKKVGAKKQRKLEMKAEKKAARERELEDREERKKRQAILDEERRKKEDAEREEEKKKEEDEKRLKEEKERQEHEEYLKMKEAFEVEEEGFDDDVTEIEQQNRLQAFIDYIKNEKVVLLEDLAGNFHMRTQEAINRINSLLEDQLLTGVIDDRGKFIYISPDELKEFAKFIKRRGRVSISELVENSHTLIKLKS